MNARELLPPYLPTGAVPAQYGVEVSSRLHDAVHVRFCEVRGQGSAAEWHAVGALHLPRVRWLWLGYVLRCGFALAGRRLLVREPSALAGGQQRRPQRQGRLAVAPGRRASDPPLS